MLSVTLFNTILAWGGLVTQVGLVLYVIYWLMERKNNPAVRWVGSNAIALAFVTSLVATACSLTYSNIFHFTPCELCWFQRIFMYPQVILLGLALIKKDTKIVDYSLALSCIGAVIAFYHYLLQIGLVQGSCATVGYSVSCSKQFVLELGYISIPVMSLTAFLLIITVLLSQKLSKPIDVAQLP